MRVLMSSNKDQIYVISQNPQMRVLIWSNKDLKIKAICAQIEILNELNLRDILERKNNQLLRILVGTR